MPLGKDRAITQKGARALFVSSFMTRRRRLIYPTFCEVIDSHVEQDFARAIGTVPQLEEVIPDVNDPALADFREYYWDWTNRLYKMKFSINRSLMDFDQVRQTETLLHSAGARIANLPDLILVTRLVNGSLYSGERDSSGNQIALISSSHLGDVGGTVSSQSNSMSGTCPVDFCTAASTTAVAQQLLNDLRRAQARMRRFLDDQGQPWHDDELRGEDLVILCGPLLEHAWAQALKASQLNASDNIYQDAVNRVVTTNYSSAPGAGAADWWLFNKGTLRRPIIYSRFRRIRSDEIEDKYQNELGSLEVDGQTISQDDLRELASIELETNLGHRGMNSDADVIQNDRFLVGARWRGEILGGEWRNILFMDNAAT